jgi:hypothetical protein
MLSFRLFGETLNRQIFKYPDVNQNREDDLKRVARRGIGGFDKLEKREIVLAGDDITTIMKSHVKSRYM